MLEVQNLSVTYPTRNGPLRAVQDITFDVARGETLGLVGESGSGKSTVGKAILALTPGIEGRIAINGRQVSGLSQRSFRPFRKHMQMVFQDPEASLNPRKSIVASLGAPFEVENTVPRAEREARILDMLERVGLSREMARRYPHELSGGQKQRVGIARALMLNPDLIICDEAVSALDVSIQAQVLNLLTDLRRQTAFSCIFISHDLSVVKYVSDRIAVMYRGSIVEVGTHSEIWERPRHHYTQKLFAALPGRARTAGPARTEDRVATGPVAPGGCVFKALCPRADVRCHTEPPAFTTETATHRFACHHPLG